uniref:Transmembrane protein n=1 Tax=Ditylenchus dipsaci TaxID=166011 RepID=A0A915DLE5_9BILA
MIPVNNCMPSANENPNLRSRESSILSQVSASKRQVNEAVVHRRANQTVKNQRVPRNKEREMPPKYLSQYRRLKLWKLLVLPTYPKVVAECVNLCGGYFQVLIVSCVYRRKRIFKLENESDGSAVFKRGVKGSLAVPTSTGLGKASSGPSKWKLTSSDQ